MNPVIIIPTYVGPRHRSTSEEVVGTYDHATPITHQGELPRCLCSLRDNGITAPVILLVVADDSVQSEAGEKIRTIASSFTDSLSLQVVDFTQVSRLHERMSEMGADSAIEAVGLVGYGAVRNLGLLMAAIRGFSELIFIDDDEVVTSPDFLKNALYGLGKLSPKGVPILVKTGYYTDAQGRWTSTQRRAWYNRFWGQGEAFNKWMNEAISSTRLSFAHVLSGGCLAIHREAFIRIAFDAWISRGEDLDYLLNVLMYGGRPWFDNQWHIQHKPPMQHGEGQRFRQDIYRWVYEHRKLEFAKSQIDLLQIQTHSLDPYPGPFLEHDVTWRAALTALLRTLGRPRDRQGYLRAALAAPKDARSYAQDFCARYFEFQRLWSSLVADLEADPVSQQIMREGILEQTTGATGAGVRAATARAAATGDAAATGAAAGATGTGAAARAATARAAATGDAAATGAAAGATGTGVADDDGSL